MVLIFGFTPFISHAGEQTTWGPSYELSELIGKDVVNKPCEVSGNLGMYAAVEGKITSATLTNLTDLKCEVVGRIVDFVVYGDRISYVILGRGGFLHLAQESVAFPVTALSREPMGRPFVLDVRSDRTASAPVYDQTRLSSRMWAEDVYKYFGQQPSWSEEAKEFSDLIRTTVADSTGEEIGHISDLVMDSNGRISLAILSYGEDLELGETGKQIALPYSALSPTDAPHRCVLNVSEEKLASAPGYERTLLDNQKWVENTYRHFGMQPYWTEE
jgi:sporulation protein YlmC with PRC-barrel domain